MTEPAGKSYVIRLNDKPEDWVPLLSTNETIPRRQLSADSDTYKFGSLSANYWNRSVVWYDTASQRAGRIVTVDINTTSTSVIGFGSKGVSQRPPRKYRLGSTNWRHQSWGSQKSLLKSTVKLKSEYQLTTVLRIADYSQKLDLHVSVLITPALARHQQYFSVSHGN